MTTDRATEPSRSPSRSEVQSAIGAAARNSGKRVLDAGRGQPNWIATEPRSAMFTLGSFAVGEAETASTHPAWGEAPPTAGISDRLDLFLARTAPPGSALLGEVVRYGVDELGFDADAWVHELTLATLGAGYPSPTRMLTHVEQVMRRYLVMLTGSDGPAEQFRIFGTEGGAAAMADVFRSLKENGLVGHGDAIAIATPVFTPYLQIPTLEDFGFRVVEIESAHDTDHRFDAGAFDPLLDPSIKAFIVINPGNPDSRAIRPERLLELRDFVLERRPDLMIVADTAYATFVDGFRGLMADLPHNVICLHSFSKNFGATGNRLGFVAVHVDNAMDRRLAAAAAESADFAGRQQDRYGSITSDVGAYAFIDRMVADSREVALHNIAGLATPDQVQMALFALTALLPRGREYIVATRVELAARLDALLAPLGIPAPGGHDSMYYALVDLLAVARVRHGDEAARSLEAGVRPEAVALQLAADHGVVVLPGMIFDAQSWDVRVSLASLSAADLASLGEAISAVVDSAIDTLADR